MARARSRSGCACSGLAQVAQNQGKSAQVDGDVGVVGAVGSLGDGQGALEEREGVIQLGVDTQVGSGPVQQPRGVLQQSGGGCLFLVQVGRGGQYVRQQHRPPRPRPRIAGHFAGRVRAQQAQRHRQRMRRALSSAVLRSGMFRHCTTQVMIRSTVPYTAIPRCKLIHSQFSRSRLSRGYLP
jgi:hypothetical protein